MTAAAPELRSSYSQHGVFVTHNGDFHSYELFGRRLSCVELMAWLAVVLDAPAPARCDSVAIAGETYFAAVLCAS